MKKSTQAYDVYSVSLKSASKSKRSIKEEVKQLQDDFVKFGSNPKNQHLQHIMKVLSEDNVPEEVLCRDKQRQSIEAFIQTALKIGFQPEVLYIAGVPGIGKTLCVKNVINKLKKTPQFSNKNVIFIEVNVMKIKQPNKIFRTILSQLINATKIQKEEQKKGFYHKASYILNDYFQKGISKEIKIPPSVLKVIVIDQMDYLTTEDYDVIYTIVEWIRHKKSHLAIIGISNMIDLPQNFSLKIASRFGNQRIVFSQYTAKQIGQILGQRLNQCQGVFQSQAIEYICKKIGGQQTDIRKCLHILRESINRQIDIERKKDRNNIPQINNIPKYIVAEVVKDLYYDSFVDSYPQFPKAYKIVLLAMAKYFREQRQSLAYSHLQHILGNSVIKSINQLKAILFDLRDLGLISIRNMCLRTDNRITLQFRQFKIPKNVEEEFISLLIDVDKIFIAFDADERENPQGYSQLDRFRFYRR